MLKTGGFLSRAKKKEGRLKKQHLIAFSLMISIFFLCGTALAVPFTWAHTVNASHYIGWFSSYSYEHNLNGLTLAEGDVITGYTLAISLKDDNDCLPEIAKIYLPGIMSDVIYHFDNNNPFGWDGSLSLNHLGTLNIKITSLLGDFFFDKSILTATGYSNTAPVPEPASMLLFGTGLIVFGLAGRKLKAR
jgi:hypothetical protein